VSLGPISKICISVPPPTVSLIKSSKRVSLFAIDLIPDGVAEVAGTTDI